MTRSLNRTSNPSSYAELKAKQRRLRVNFPEHVGLRVHRAISWLGRSEKEEGDPDVCFLLLWISFNAAYAAELEGDLLNERGVFNAYFRQIVSLDTSHRIYNAVWDRFSQEIRVLLENRYVFAPFWQNINEPGSQADWEARLLSSQSAMSRAITVRDTAKVLSTLFDRLYVLRNQLVHGGATWNSTVNRRQVKDGSKVLRVLLPIMIDIMMDNPDHDWGKPFYPVVR